MSDDEFRPAQMISERLAERIRTEGSLSVAAFMAEALFHPMAGFYATKDPLGAANDFITAPEISQMFGELLGLYENDPSTVVASFRAGNGGVARAPRDDHGQFRREPVEL